MPKTINDYPKSSGTKEEVLAWWKQYTRNLTLDEIQDMFDEYSYRDNGVEPLDGFEAVEIASTGAEGDGADMAVTYQIKSVTNYSKVLGYVQLRAQYSSWDSPTWDEDVYVVNPTEVTRIEFI